MLQSIICRAEHFRTDWFARWAEALGFACYPATFHRKEWEWAAICQALDERGKLAPEMRGLGFAVGQEPLASLFAARGAEVIATDFVQGEHSALWGSSGQHAASLEAVFKSELIAREAFDRRVGFRNADMNDLSQFPADAFDFVWSSCAMEHIGSLARGLAFVRNAARLLKPGGVAVHTTEFNLWHLSETLDTPGQSFYRESDFRQLDLDLRQRFCCLERLDLFPGTDAEDVLYDFPPYSTHGHMHVKLLAHEYLTTSALLIVKRFR